jgi:hypothetical protein
MMTEVYHTGLIGEFIVDWFEVFIEESCQIKYNSNPALQNYT